MPRGWHQHQGDGSSEELQQERWISRDGPKPRSPARDEQGSELGHVPAPAGQAADA